MSSTIRKNSNKTSAMKTRENETALVGRNQVHLVGFIATATTSRTGVLARKMEIPQPGAREVLELECEKKDIFPDFRSVRVNQWVEVRGRIRRRFWRAGSVLASRSYIEVTSITPR